MRKNYFGEMIRKIRCSAGISQSEMADYMGVSFATVNRWENGHAEPVRSAQERLCTFCIENKVPLMSYMQERIDAVAQSLSVPSNKLLLYHGSKRGLEGEIAPISRVHCDFGPGFYMGTLPEQPLTLICGFPKSKFYLVSVSLDQIKTTQVPADLEWAMLVAYHRGKMETIKGTSFYEKYRTFADDCDMVIGSIANDKMFQVLDDFFIGNITDAALVKSLAALELGKQYVAITQKGCDAVQIEAEIKISHLEKLFLQALSEENRTKGVSLANDICKANRRVGKYFDELLEDGGKG